MSDPITLSLVKLQRVLNEFGYDYVFIGGVSVFVFGRSRMTMDLDVIVDEDPSRRSDFVEALQKAGFMIFQSDLDVLDEGMHGSFFLEESMFRIDMKGIFSPKDRYSLENAVEAEFNGVPIRVDCPENIIINKLILGSEQDWEDAISVFVRNKDTLDMEELEKLARMNGVEEEFTLFFEELGSFDID